VCDHMLSSRRKKIISQAQCKNASWFDSPNRLCCTARAPCQLFHITETKEKRKTLKKRKKTFKESWCRELTGHAMPPKLERTKYYKNGLLDAPHRSNLCLRVDAALKSILCCTISFLFSFSMEAIDRKWKFLSDYIMDPWRPKWASFDFDF